MGQQREGQMERAALKHVHYHTWDRPSTEMCRMAQVAQIECPVTTRGMGWSGKWEGGGTCIPVAGSCWFMAEKNMMLLSNNLTVKNKKTKMNIKVQLRISYINKLMTSNTDHLCISSFKINEILCVSINW